MADNLTVSIGADSSKLRAELALVNAATKAAQKELASLAAAFNSTGANADRLKLDTKARQLDQYTRSATSLKRAIADLSPTFASVGKSAEHAASGLESFVHQGRGLGRVFSEFSTMTRGIESFGGILGKLGGGFAGGLFGVGIAKAFTGVLDQINETSKALRELRDQAGQIGVKPIVLQAAQDIAKDMGEDADVATKMLQGLSKQFDEVRKQSAQRPEDRVAVLRGGAAAAQGMVQLGNATAATVEVFRGGTQAVTDFTKPLEVLGVDLRTTPLAKLGGLDDIRKVLTAFIAKSKTLDPRGMILETQNLFPGVTPEAAVKVAQAYVDAFDAEMAKLEKSPRGATAPKLSLDEEFRKSQAARQKAVEEATAPMADAAERTQINLNTNITEMLKAWGTMGSEMSTSWASMWAAFSTGTQTAVADFKSITVSEMLTTWQTMVSEMSTSWNSMWAALSSGAQTAASDFRSIWASALEWLANATATVVSAAKSAASSAASAIGEASTLGIGFAAGGMVRGSGSGTSDSILARLSNGEFVMRAQAVQHWGPQLLASLNALRDPGFALGGMVSSFAEGGLVAAGSGGRPVNLILGGNSFALSGHDSVVDALVHEAHRQQMRSAGTKPSWFAGKPGGR